MDAWVWLLLLVVVAYVFIRWAARSKVAEGEGGQWKTSKNQRVYSENIGFLEERWKLASDALDGKGNGPISFPDWYYDDATDRQLERLREDGISVKRGQPSKGQASDLIGIFESASEADLEVLKFFKVPVKGINQTKARHEVAMIFADEEKHAKWRRRPPTATQREFFKFMGEKLPSGSTHADAERLINEYWNEHEDDERLEEWESFQSLLAEFADAAFREDYEIKRIGSKLLKDTILGLKESGTPIAEQEEDPQVVVDAILQERPDLERQ